MKTYEKRSSSIMKNNATLKEALNRQFVALATDHPLEKGLFSCQQFEEVASGAPGFTIGSFEDEYPILSDRLTIPLRSR